MDRRTAARQWYSGRTVRQNNVMRSRVYNGREVGSIVNPEFSVVG